jgi:hypothetical protein
VAPALAAIGDALFWGTLRPFCAALALLCAVGLWRAGPSRGFFLMIPAVYLATYDAAAVFLRWRGLSVGFESKDAVALSLKQFPWQPLIRALRWAGTGLALAAVVLALGSSLLGPGGRWKAAAAFAAAAAAFKLVPGASGLRLYAAACVAGCLAAAAGWML